MQDDRNTGTSEFKAVAREAAQLGSRLARATRAWFEARRDEVAERQRERDGNAARPSGTRERGSRQRDDWREHDPANVAESAAVTTGHRRSDGGYGSDASSGTRGYGHGAYGRQGGLAGGSASGRAGGDPLHPHDSRPGAGPSAGAGHRGKGPRNFARSDDRIREDVCQRLADDDGIDASGIEVDVKDGIVTLTGTVAERRMKHLAEDLAEHSSGVRDVDNRVRVQRPGAAAATTDDATASSLGAGVTAGVGGGSGARVTSGIDGGTGIPPGAAGIASPGAGSSGAAASPAGREDKAGEAQAGTAKTGPGGTATRSTPPGGGTGSSAGAGADPTLGNGH